MGNGHRFDKVCEVLRLHRSLPDRAFPPYGRVLAKVDGSGNRRFYTDSINISGAMQPVPGGAMCQGLPRRSQPAA